MADMYFQRQFRTLSSEGYQIVQDGQRVGRVDLHFAAEKVYATIVLETEMEETEVARVIEEIDDQLVVTATVMREDLNVWVYNGTEVGFYSDEFPEGLDDDQIEEDELDDLDDEYDEDEDEDTEPGRL